MRGERKGRHRHIPFIIHFHPVRIKLHFKNERLGKPHPPPPTRLVNPGQGVRVAVLLGAPFVPWAAGRAMATAWEGKGAAERATVKAVVPATKATTAWGEGGGGCGGHQYRYGHGTLLK